MKELYINDDAIIFNGKSITLNVKFASLFLRLLLEKRQHNDSLTLKKLEETIHFYEPDYKLHRMQITRLLGYLENTLKKLGICGEIYTQARKRTTGPWKLVLHSRINVTFTNLENTAQPKERYLNPIFRTRSEYNIHLKEFLMSIINVKCFYDEGLHKEARELIRKCYQFEISDDLKCRLDIYQAKILNSMGEYHQATILLNDIITHRQSTERTEMVNIAKLALARIEYNKSPATNYLKILDYLEKPKYFAHQDSMTLMNWHNLKALLLRRRMLMKKDGFLQDYEDALIHLEAALFSALWLENRELLLSYILNYTFHLQKSLEIDLASLEEVLHWYQLSMTYVDKQGDDRSSIWSEIFFAQFYLKYRNKIHQLNSYIEISSRQNPWQEEFYLTNLNKALDINNKRQYLILMFSYLKFLQDASIHKQKEIAHKICLELSQNKELAAELIQDDYNDIISQAYRLASL